MNAHREQWIPAGWLNSSMEMAPAPVTLYE